VKVTKLSAKFELTTSLVRFGAVLMALATGVGCGSSSDDRIAELESQLAALSSTTSSSSTSSSTTSSTTTIPLVVIPDLRGYDRNQAADVLRELGLFATFVERPDEAKEGTVTGTTPGRGFVAEVGSTVEIRYAVPILHTVTVSYDVRSNLWSNLPDGECEHRDAGVEEGQSVTLAGPDGVLLGSAAVTNGTVVNVGPSYWYDDYDGKVCRFEFTFIDIPEVAAYIFETKKRSDFPPVSLDDAKFGNWTLTFGWGY
jgi:hypothetical protein